MRSYTPDQKMILHNLGKGKIFYEESQPEILYVILIPGTRGKDDMVHAKSLSGITKLFDPTTPVMYVRNTHPQG